MAPKVTRRRAVAALLVPAVLAVCGCSGAGGGHTEERTVVVLAAASLTEPFTAIRDEFARQHPQYSVETSFASSSALSTQLINGSQADVFASADRANMTKVETEGLVTGRVEVFARNTLTIVVPAGNPGDIKGLADLNRPGLRLAMGAPAVPAGRAAREAFGKAGLAVPATSEEPDVKAVISRVVLGEADAGIAWVTDCRAAGNEVEAVPIPDAVNVITEYPIARLVSGRNGEGADALVAFIRSGRGQEILRDHGFLTG